VLGFRRHELKNRYDVKQIEEDEWHSYSGKNTEKIISNYLPSQIAETKYLLNAGAGVYKIGDWEWKEIVLDLFTNPIRDKSLAVCANIEQLPFRSQTFGAIICVGEVLAYCDPARAIAEFARIIEPSGILICDFASSKSIRYLFREPYGRAADIITDLYNGTPERTWVYNPRYIQELLNSAGFVITICETTHSWSALALRLGLSKVKAFMFQRYLSMVPFPKILADLVTIVAVRTEYEPRFVKKAYVKL
jgi:SAM-dependent methyltransferase